MPTKPVTVEEVAETFVQSQQQPILKISFMFLM